MCGKLGPPLMTSTQRSTKNSTSLCTTPASAEFDLNLNVLAAYILVREGGVLVGYQWLNQAHD
jgi:hypothetical protein